MSIEVKQDSVVDTRAFFICKVSTKFVALQLENLSTSWSYFSGSKDLSLGGLAMSAECIDNGFQANCKAKVNEKRPVGHFDNMDKMALLYQRSWLEPLGTSSKRNSVCCVVVGLIWSCLLVTLKKK